MQSFNELSSLFSEKFNKHVLALPTGRLYEAGNYFMQLGVSGFVQ
jgi:hypothetical protein